MDINALTIGQIKELSKFFGHSPQQSHEINDFGIGQKVIIRTFSAGVWFGDLDQKSGKEIILKNARRLWKWHAAEGISLSAVATHGVKYDQSKIAVAVASVWLEAIEIIPCTNAAAKIIQECENARAE